MHTFSYARSIDWHPTLPLIAIAHDDGIFTLWNETDLKPYWRGVELSGQQKVSISSASQVLNGDREPIDRKLVYYIETDAGEINLMTPTE